MACLVLLLAVCITAATCNGEGWNSFSELFRQRFRDGQADNCDVRKYEEVTGFQLDSCYVAPIDGLVPDDTVCDFTAGYMTRTTQYCGSGFWFTVQDHPHYHQIMKREVDAIRSILKYFNQHAAEEDKFDLVTLSTSPSTTQTTTATGSDVPSAHGWVHCYTDPIIVIPGSGETDVNLKDYFEEPSKTEPGWTVSLLETSAKWIDIDGEKLIASAATYNGKTKTISYKAVNDDTGNKQHCILKFEFAVKMCDISNIKSHANSTKANVACGNKFWGIYGERCNMTCKDVDQSMNDENKNVHVTCEMDEEDNVEWKWYAKDEESDDALEEIEQPDCEPIVCRQDEFHASEYEESLLECQDSDTGDYAPVGAADGVYAGSYCRRACSDKGGEVCEDMEAGAGDMEGAERELSTYNYYTCSYNRVWIKEEPAKCGSNNVWKNCTEYPMVSYGRMCCSGDRCTVTCNEGFSPNRGSKPVAVCRQDGADREFKWHRCEDDTDVCEVLEEFPGKMCKATCDGLPYELTNMVTDSVTPDCSGIEIGGRCNISCSDYSTLNGSSYATCEFNDEDHSAEWRIPDWQDEPRCEAQPCENLVAPDGGTVLCMYDWEDDFNTCNVTCEEGFTHNLRYRTKFQCETYGSGNWPDKADIPKCVEASAPEVKLTFEATLEANLDTCNRLRDFVVVDNITASVLSQCPPTCNCTPGDFSHNAMGENECVVELPVALECGGYGLSKQIAMVWSMINVPSALNEDITITKYPSITDIEETCREGWSLDTQDEWNPMCILCNKGTAYNEDTHQCEQCASGNSVDGECVDYAATEPDPVKCEKFDMRRRDLKFNNCSTQLTDDDSLIVDTYCKVECEDYHYLTVYSDVNMGMGGPVFATCTSDGDKEEGKWQYTPEDFSCEAHLCSIGHFSDSGQEPCNECEIGKYSFTEGSKECWECPDGLVAPQRGLSTCVTEDSVTCNPGYYLDDSLECQICPFSGYCEDGIYMQSCPEKMVTEEEGSVSVDDCKNDTWRVIGDGTGGPNEQRVTISDLEGLPSLAFMEFRMCSFSSDLRVEFNIPPYRLQIDGNGDFDFTDSNNMVCKGDDFFKYSQTECGTNVTISVDEYNIELNYGGPSVLCWPNGGGYVTPIDENLDEMTITVSPRDIRRRKRGIEEIAVEDDPYFAYMALYRASDISTDDPESQPGDSSSWTDDYNFGSMPPDYYADDDYSSGYSSGMSSSGSWNPGDYSSSYSSGMSSSGSWNPWDYSSSYSSGTSSSGSWNPGDYSSSYSSGTSSSGSWSPGDYSSSYSSGMSSSGSWNPGDYSSSYSSGMSSSGSWNPGDYSSSFSSGTSSSGSWNPGDYSSSYSSGMSSSGSWNPGDYSSSYSSGMSSSGSWNPGDYSSSYSNEMPPTGSWSPEDFSSSYWSDVSSSSPSTSEDYTESTPFEGSMVSSLAYKRRKRGLSPTSTVDSSSISTSEMTSGSTSSSTSTISSSFSSTTSTPSSSSPSTSSSTISSSSSFTTSATESTTSWTTSSTTGSSTSETTPYSTTTSDSYLDGESGYANRTSDGSSNNEYGPDSSDTSYTRTTPNRNCFNNIMNGARFSDRDDSTRPASCRQKDCGHGNEKPDHWTCKPCPLGSYYEFASEKCASCPNYGMTRKAGTTEVEECHGDSWSVRSSTARVRRGIDSGPSAVITGLVLSGYCSLNFLVHKPAVRLDFIMTFHQYQLTVYSDMTFEMHLREDLIIDGSIDNFFEEVDGWLAVKITFDDATKELVLNFGERERRSSQLSVDYEIPVGEDIDFNIDVMSDSSDALLYLAYLQVYEDCDMTDDCRANVLADSWDYLEGSGVSNKQPYSCPDIAEHWSCKEPREIFGNMTQFACTNGRSLYSQCTVNCTDKYYQYLHGDTHIKCMGTHWEFDMPTRGVPECKSEPPEIPTCREPKLPDNVMWTETPDFSGSFRPECNEPGYEFRRGGYNQTTVYMCDNDNLQWEPSTDLIPGCFKPESQRPSMAAHFEIYNPWKLSCEEIRNVLTEVMGSREVTVNSPMEWDAELEIFKLHCGALEGASTEAAAEDDPEIKNIREQSDCDDCDHDCYEQLWTDIHDHVKAGLESNVGQVFGKFNEMAAASSDGRPDIVEDKAQEMIELADKSNTLLNDDGMKEFIKEVELKSENCSDYEAKKKFGILYTNINETVSNFTKSVKANVKSVEQQAQSYGAAASGRNMKLDAKITASLSGNDWYDIQQISEMLKEFARSLNDSGQTVVSNSSKTDVLCKEGKVIASKGQCEAKSCLTDETKDENGECKKCNKWTSIIDETGQCVLCRDNERVSETKDGMRACTEPCPAGTASTDGFTDPNTGECTPCEPSEYQDNEGSQQCQRCPGIQNNFVSASTSCTHDYDLCLTNTRETSVVLKELNRGAELTELTFSVMVKKSTAATSFGVEFAGYSATLDDTGVTLCGVDGEDCAVFQYHADSTERADFVDFTQLAFIVGSGNRKAYIDGVELTSENSSYPGQFSIPADSDFNTHGSACITNWFISGEIEDVGDLSTRDGIAKDSNMFRDASLQAEEYDSSQATTKPSAYTGQPTDYCANNPCKNGGSCSRAIGRGKCTCMTGYEGHNCEKKFDVQEPTWSDWRNGSCSVTCGEGTLTQNRTCQVEPCTGDASRNVPCTQQTCKVCPTLEFNPTKVSANTSVDGSTTIMEFYCSGRRKFAKIGGNKSPKTVTKQCGPGTDFEWEDNAIAPQCAVTAIASTYTETHKITFLDPARVDNIPCDSSLLEQWKTDCKLDLAKKVTCMNNTSTLYPCRVGSVEVPKCSAGRRKRATSDGDLVLVFQVDIDDNAKIDIQNMYDNNVVSESLLEVVQALADLDNVLNELQTLTLTINNVNYTVDPATLTSTSSVTCQTGQYADGTDCVNCGAGTYQDTSTTFCVQCPKGEYQDQEAMTSCNSCPEGFTTENTGSTASSYCNITVASNTSCRGSNCDGNGGDKEDGGGSDGKTIGIAIGATVAGLLLIGGVAAVIYRANAASKAKSASLPYNQNLIHPKNPSVPEKQKLYNEIVNPHFVPPPKPAQAAYSQPSEFLAEPPSYEYLTVGQPDARAVTPPGTVMTDNP